MKDWMDIFEKPMSIIASFLAIITSLLGIIISVTIECLWIIIPFILITIIVIVFFGHYIKIRKYINFVEFLFNNKKHRFTLLPKLRIYIESTKNKNKVHVTNLNIKYSITKNKNFSDNIGDLRIEYDMQIENKHLPKQYYVIFGNDYAENKPKIEYSLCNRPLVSVTFHETKHASYERGLVNEAVINFDNDNFPKSEISLKIIHNYINSFNFSETETDTLILLPLLYGNKIDHINYEINLIGFEDYPKLYCDAYEISDKGLLGIDYEIKDVSTYTKDENLSKSISLNNAMKYEGAYYVRIGVSEEKMEP